MKERVHSDLPSNFWEITLSVPWKELDKGTVTIDEAVEQLSDLFPEEMVREFLEGMVHSFFFCFFFEQRA